MQYEVEQKFPVANLPALVNQLTDAGVKLGPPVEQVDQYFSHPTRDFAASDEALRIRRVGSDTCITYKGPRLAGPTKTREEIEIDLRDGTRDTDGLQRLLLQLGFRSVANVRKMRRSGQLPCKSWNVQLALDQVDEVGDFLELELLCSPEQLEEASQAVVELSEKLQLRGAERRSYLELLLSAK